MTAPTIDPARVRALIDQWHTAGTTAVARDAEDRIAGLLAGNAAALGAWRQYVAAAEDHALARWERATEAQISDARRAESGAWDALLDALGLEVPA